MNSHKINKRDSIQHQMQLKEKIKLKLKRITIKYQKALKTIRNTVSWIRHQLEKITEQVETAKAENRHS